MLASRLGADEAKANRNPYIFDKVFVSFLHKSKR